MRHRNDPSGRSSRIGQASTADTRRGSSAHPPPRRTPSPMTVSHAGAALPAHDFDGAIATLRSSGLRVSAARRLVLEALFRADGPVTAAAITDGLDGRVPVSDLGSTYRNRETREERGRVRHVHLGHGPGRDAPAAREYLV